MNANKKREEEKKPLVIQPLANRDWKEASRALRAQKYGITGTLQRGEGGPEGAGEAADAVVKEKEGVRYGLNIPTTAKPEDVQDTNGVEHTEQEETQPEPEVHKTDDQRAIDALTGVQQTSTLTIPTTEEEAFTHSYHSAPPAPTLSDYAAVPVEEYGAAMLRGMGWKGPTKPNTPNSSKPNAKKVPPPPKRPALLGIGADPNAAISEELGAWGRNKGRGREKEVIYNPLVLKNKGTGERLTEDELREKMKRQKEDAANEKFVVEDLEIRDKRKGERNGDADKEREREKRRRRDRDTSPSYDDREREKRKRDRDYDRKERSDRRDRDREPRDKNRDYERSSGRRERYDDEKERKRDRYDDEKDRKRDRYDDERGYKSKESRRYDDRERERDRDRERERERERGYRSSRR